jgi:hypothetical protein
MSFTTTALIVTWFAIVLLALALAGIVRQVRSLVTLHGIRLNPVGPALGSAAPAIEGSDGYGQGRSTILLFADAACQSCEQVLAELGSLWEGSVWRVPPVPPVRQYAGHDARLHARDEDAAARAVEPSAEDFPSEGRLAIPLHDRDRVVTRSSSAPSLRSPAARDRDHRRTP